MFTVDLYISANAGAVVECLFRRRIWGGAPFRDTLLELLEHSKKEIGAAGAEKFRVEILRKLSSSLASSDALLHFASGQRKRQCRPVYNSVSEYIRNEWETNAPVSRLLDVFRLEQSELVDIEEVN